MLLIKASGYREKQEPDLLDLFDPAIGLKISKHLVDQGIPFPFPLFKDDGVVYQVYAEMMGNCMSRDTMMGLAMYEGAMKTLGTALKCFLINGYDYRTISRFTGVSVQSIKVFEKLCFNVLDRLDEKLYLSQIVFPNSRYEQFQANYLKKVDYGDLILRACYQDKSIPRIMYLNSLRATEDNQEELTSCRMADMFDEDLLCRKELEYEQLVINGGLLNQKDVTAPIMKRRMAVSKKVKDSQVKSNGAGQAMRKAWLEYLKDNTFTESSA